MTKEDLEWVRHMAEGAIRAEDLNAALEAEKARLRRRARLVRFLKRLAFWRYL